MTLPSSGSISMSQVASELGIGAGGLNLNDSRVRNLAGIGSGTISMANLRGKSSVKVTTVGVSYSALNFAYYANGVLAGYAAGYYSVGSTAYRPDGQFVTGANGWGSMGGINIRGASIAFFGNTVIGGAMELWCTLHSAVSANGFSVVSGGTYMNFTGLEGGATRFFKATSHNVGYYWTYMNGTWTFTVP